jgi:hypothetical protein
MTATTATTGPARASGATDLDLLTGPGAGSVLRAALAGAGAGLRSWHAEQVEHRPGRGSTVAYRAWVAWPGRQLTEERLVAHTGQAPEGALTVDNGADRVAVWRFPHDPYLPGLAVAYDSGAVATLLRRIGLGGGPVELRLRAYRPRRRAVVEAVGSGGRLFLKVIRPARVEELHRRHRQLVDAGVPAPPSLGYTPGGLLVLQAIPGQPLRRALRSRGGPLPSGAAVLDLLDRLPAELAEGPPRRSWLDRAPHHAAVVAAALPSEAERAGQLAAAVTAGAGAGRTVPVHGDFYENQLIVQQGRITGLLDVDTAGPGDRLDDLACLLGHLSVLAQTEPGGSGQVSRLGARYLAAFEAVVDPVDLRRRVAAVVLSLATGPHRVQERGWPVATRRRLGLVEQWLDSARPPSPAPT